MSRRVFLGILAVAALAGCASAPEPALRTYELGAVTTRYLALDDVNRECESRMRNGQSHWGCGTFYRSSRACEIVAQPLRGKLDFDRAAILGVELDNCNRMAAGEP